MVSRFDSDCGTEYQWRLLIRQKELFLAVLYDPFEFSLLSQRPSAYSQAASLAFSSLDMTNLIGRVRSASQPMNNVAVCQKSSWLCFGRSLKQENP